MAAMANMLVKDDATAPVEYTFKPVTDTPIPLYRTAIVGVPFEGQMRAWFSEELVKSGAYKRTVKVEIPVMETLGASGTSAGYVAPPKVAYVDTIIFTMFSAARATQADRANTLKIGMGVIQGATSTTATGTLANTTAGDGWKNSTAPGPTFFVNGELPN
ncbi:coat protein [ssRNA phage Gerhypos.3_22]|uniref:Coat protein n=2 Tax=Fiersviridae TaxID=2842319 RepID=A0A8S5L1T3_9VIRU|nr:coat protein [ssRNA phage Gerhypos.3_22]QDH89247.1 MAG: hypothetical protein H3Bulk42307_000002 [Leviviridae sp.]DAD51317.1 TPA_asm: coat protein [ssRNA phage Gerhypos.3_22]